LGYNRSISARTETPTGKEKITKKKSKKRIKEGRKIKKRGNKSSSSYLFNKTKQNDNLKYQYKKK